MASVYGMNFKIVDLAYDLNNDTLHWPTATAFQLFVQHKGIYLNCKICCPLIFIVFLKNI